MRKALFILALVMPVLIFSENFSAFSPQFFSGAFLKDPAQKYKYEYLFDTELPTEKFKEVFYNRLMSKHHWSPMGETNLVNDTYNSMWRFTDENKQSWECAVTIKRTANEKVAVTLEMIPILES